VVGVLLAFGFHLLHALVQPYKDPVHGLVQHAALGCTWLTLLAGLCIKLQEVDQAQANVLAGIVLLLNYSVVLGSGVVVVGTARKRLQGLTKLEGPPARMSVELPDCTHRCMYL
jgi:hypothetical protein